MARRRLAWGWKRWEVPEGAGAVFGEGAVVEGG